MNGVTQINSVYNHSQLVNRPPFITNYPLIEPIETQKREFKKNEHELFHQEHNKQKTTNGIIWTCVIALPVCIFLAGRYVYKKTQHVLNKIKAAF